MTLLEVCSPLYGDLFAIAHELTGTEALVEMGYAPPVGTELTLRIGEAGELVLRAVVIGHHSTDDQRLVRMRLAGAEDAECRTSVH